MTHLMRIEFSDAVCHVASRGDRLDGRVASREDWALAMAGPAPPVTARATAGGPTMPPWT